MSRFKRHYAHFGRPKSRVHKHNISVAMKARAVRVRAALALLDQHEAAQS